MRCKRLADALLSTGIEVIFISRISSQPLLSRLSRDFNVIALPSDQFVSDLNSTADNSPPSQSISEIDDAHQVVEALYRNNIRNSDYLILDHYSLGASWEEYLLSELSKSSSFVPYLMVIDDLANRPHICDCLLDQNFFGEHPSFRYDQLVPSTCKKLLGPKYALLSPEYSYLHPLAPFRTSIHRILIFFGGSDIHDLTIISILSCLQTFSSNIAIDVVTGFFNPSLGSIKELCDANPNISLYSDLSSLSALILRADLAIGACGSTQWERSCLKLPSIIVSCAPNQSPISSALHEAGYAYSIGSTTDFTQNKLTSAIEFLSSNYFDYAHKQSLTNGSGCLSVAATFV